MGNCITPNTNFLSTLNSGEGLPNSPTPPPEPTPAPSLSPQPAPTESPVILTAPTPQAESSPEPSPQPTLAPTEPPIQPTVAPTQTTQPANNLQQPQPPRRWVRPLRALLWLIIAIALPVGLALCTYSGSYAAFASNTYDTLAFWGNIIFWPSLILAILNFIWGTIRWFTRWHREHWRIGRVIGKIIGGGIWRTAIFTPIVLIALLLIAPPLYRTIHQNTLATHEQEFLTSDSLLLADYEAGKLTPDQYLNYLLDTLDTPSSLPEQYQGNSSVFLPDYLHFADEHLDELEISTLQRVYNLATLADVRFDTDASGNLSTNNSPFSQNAYDFTSVTTLNHAKLSTDQHFVIFYTDTGDNAVTDDEVNKLSEMLERIIKNYQERLGLKYTYEQILSTELRTDITFIKIILRANNIDEDILKTAMPVYLINPYSKDTNSLASYAGRKFTETIGKIVLKLGNALGDEDSALYTQIPSYPFINILPKNLHNQSLESVTAHELGHHYNSNYCYANYGKACVDDNFIDETMPNWLAIHVVDEQPSSTVIGGHYRNYIQYGYCYNIKNTIPLPPAEHACHSKNSFEGYPAVGFLETYSEIVPNSQELFFQAVALGDAHYFLYSQAGIINYRQIMITLAERNLTKDFRQSVFKNGRTPTGEDIPCNDLCTQKYYIAPSSSRYLYFPTSAFTRTNLKVTAPAFNAISILGRKDGIWHVIESNLDEATYEITSQADYDVVAFAIANFSLDESSEFTLDVTATDLEDIIDDEPTIDGIDIPVTILSDNCIGINIEGILDFPAQMYHILNQVYSSQELTNSIQKLEAESAELKNNLTFRYATICANYLKPHLDYRTARLSIKKTFSPSLEILNLQDSNSNSATSVIISANPLLNEAKAHILIKPSDSETLQLLTIHMYEKLPRF